MNPHELLRRFPNASKSLIAANADDYGSGVPEIKPANAPRMPVVTSEATKAPQTAKGGLAKPRSRKVMNKTETAYASILEAKKRTGEIERYEREGLTLRWPDGMTYTPDFVVWHSNLSEGGSLAWPDKRFRYLRLIETKGAWIEGDALVKFRAARAHWPEFEFQMWQQKKGSWEQLL